MKLLAIIMGVFVGFGLAALFIVFMGLFIK